ncbi:MAG: serine protease [Alphaproteobacteria bacterium]
MAAIRIALVFFALSRLATGGAAADAPPSAFRLTQVTPDPVADLVWCHEPSRDLVSRRLAWRCEGRIVDDAQARRLRRARVDRTKRILKGAAPIVPGRRRSGSGTGTIVSRGGHVLTNHHVVAQCAAVTVTPFGATEIHAEGIARDADHDLALLRAAIKSPGVATFAADPLPGDAIAVVGYPRRGLVAIAPRLETGHVYINGKMPRDDRFLLKIDVRAGNSGGPVLDRAARVVGVVVAQLNTPQHFARTGMLVHDVGVAIRRGVVLDFLRRNAVKTVSGKRPGALDDTALLARAQTFVVRIGCWR